LSFEQTHVGSRAAAYSGQDDWHTETEKQAPPASVDWVCG
jgi:hypothetical protein